MSLADVWMFLKQFGGPFLSSVAFILILFIGFCVLAGFTKLKKTSGGTARVVKSLDERISRQPMVYLSPGAPHGPADQLGFERGHSSTHPS